MASTPSRFVWYELMTTDAPAAEAFYKRVIGWDMKDAGMPGMKYTILSAGEHGVGGLMALPKDALDAGARPGWIGYIGVDDVDGCAERIRQAGGAVRKAPDDIPGVGRFAMVADPGGAMFALFKPAADEPPPARPAPGTPGTVGWHELYAADGAKAFAFYSQLFGWTRGEAMDMGPMGTYQLFHIGGDESGGMMTKPENVPMPGWLYYVNVDAVDAAAGRIREGGGQVVHGPMEVPGGSWIVQAIDPHGALFAVVAPKR